MSRTSVRSASEKTRPGQGEPATDQVGVRLIKAGAPVWRSCRSPTTTCTTAPLGGRSLRCVAGVDDQWLARLSGSGAARHVKGRDRKIGWTPRQRLRRLHLLVNNSRFLLLPDRGRYPNLASGPRDFFTWRSRALVARTVHEALGGWLVADRAPTRRTATFACAFRHRGLRFSGASEFGRARGSERTALSDPLAHADEIALFSDPSGPCK